MHGGFRTVSGLFGGQVNSDLRERGIERDREREREIGREIERDRSQGERQRESRS